VCCEGEDRLPHATTYSSKINSNSLGLATNGHHRLASHRMAHNLALAIQMLVFIQCNQTLLEVMVDHHNHSNLVMLEVIRVTQEEMFPKVTTPLRE